MPPLRWLHLSDLCLGEGGRHRRPQALEGLLRAFGEGGALSGRRPDLVFCTGDVALSGKPEQYRMAWWFFEDLARATGVPIERIFVVPGNHDVDRARVSPRFSLSLDDRAAAEAFFGPEGIEDRAIAFRRFDAFSALQRDGFGLQLSAERPFLLARCTVAGRRVGVLGLNSAWLAHEDGARGRLLVGEGVVRKGLAALKEELHGERPEVRVALLHHPLGWLRDFEQAAIRELLMEGVDFVLHGRPSGERAVLAEGSAGAAILAAGGALDGAVDEGGALLVEVGESGTLVTPVALTSEPEARRGGVVVSMGTPVPLPWRGRARGAGGGSAAPGDVGTYLRRLENETRWATLLGLSSGANALRIPLEQVFVPLRAQELGAEARSASEPEGPAARGAGELPARAGVMELWGKATFLALIGGPGSGKTTLLRRLAYLGARAFAGDAAARALLLLEASGEKSLPLLVPLPQIAGGLRAGGGAGGLVAAIADWAAREGGLSEAWLHEALLARQVTLLLDGLDEIPDLAHRQQVVEALVALARELAAVEGPGTMVVTTRPAGYGGGARLVSPFVEAQLLDLEPVEVDHFITQWVRAAEQIPSEVRLEQHPHAARQVASLRAAIQASEALVALAGQPLLLTEMAFVYHRRGHIPEQRALLYEAALEVLLRPFEGHAHFRRAVVHGGLSAVAWHLMALSAPEDLREAEQLDVLAEVVARRLSGRELSEPEHADSGSAEGGLAERTSEERTSEERASEARSEIDEALREEATALLEAQAREAGIVRISADQRCRFAHRTLQEYLAAVQLTDLTEAELQQVVAARVDEPSFRETLRLGVGILAAHRPRALSRLLSSLSGSPERPLLQRARGAAGAVSLLADVAMFDLEPFLLAPIREERDAMLGVLADPGAPELLRVGVGEALGRVGDPRLTTDLRWVEVPEGAFFRGAPARDEEAMEDERPGHEVPWLHAFQIQRWPVTIEEYTRFVEDRGYEARSFWSEPGWAFRLRGHVTAPEGWAVQRRGPWNAPVTGLSYWEAEAYCRWLERRRKSALPPGWQIRLPTESEWEKAARGGLVLGEGEANPAPERQYPWTGPWDTYQANTGFRFQRVTPVGCFPGGSGPYGAWDQAGNVWEWCMDWYDPGAWAAYERAGESGRLVALDESAVPEMPILDEQGRTAHARCRVLRGGGWGIGALIARVSYRGRGEPWRRDGVIGLRCAAGPPVS
ncbi:SUMF1/EgtB/PvdO family nonheme iron enzyme [Chondromyces crocatus]|uniref:SUMF1/EgtB/PvdO family nonheme iron enzyme n=1 Tax=Chondromyces crocatus TaxID=52 RepID=UPI001C54C5D9|nr:SUMF1/EgtB/PvdO family nonheme iron enzyme [Chondromyces crocatus]